MNWKRGAFRLWLAFSILWACGMGFYEYRQGFWQTVPPSDNAIETGAADAIACNLWKSNPGAKAEPWMQYKCKAVPDGSSTLVVLSDGPDNTWSASLPPISLTGVPKTVDGHQLANRILEAIKVRQRKERTDAYLEDAAVALLPPPVALLAGCVMAWIIAGFRRQR